MGKWKNATAEYGSSDGQIGILKPGEVDKVLQDVLNRCNDGVDDAIITSPPFVGVGMGNKCKVAGNTQVVKNSYAHKGRKTEDISYADSTQGQIGCLKSGEMNVKDKKEKKVPWRDWFSCYDDNWKGIITDKSFSHPAKMAPGLIRRIVDYGLKKNYWKKNQLLGDCFGGIGTTGITCALKGLRCVLVELEEGFVELAQKNFELLPKCIDHKPIIIQGDSRGFAKLIAGHYGIVDAVVTSPPFSAAGTQPTGRGQGVSKDYKAGKMKEKSSTTTYGDSKGQIGKLKSGELDAVIASPPEPTGRHSGGGGILTRDKKMRDSHGKSIANQMEYGQRPESIGNLDGVVTSPPFKDGSAAQAKSYNQEAWGVFVDGRMVKSYPSKRKADKRAAEMLQNEGKQANVKEVRGLGHIGSVRHKKNDTKAGYGKTDGQVGNESKESYWDAMRDVYAQCFLALKPGGVMAVHLKDYVSKKKRVPLCDQTCTLLEACGFRVFKRVRAWVVKETRQKGFKGDVVTTVARKSFFRRLAEKKGSPRIDWEEVIWVRKEKGDHGIDDAVVTSPPFADNNVNIGSMRGNSQGIGKGCKPRKNSYGTTKGQIGSLPRERETKVDGIVTSVPFGLTGQKPADGGDDPTINQKGREYARNNYGKSSGQIGRLPMKGKHK